MRTIHNSSMPQKQRETKKNRSKTKVNPKTDPYKNPRKKVENDKNQETTEKGKMGT